MAIKQKQPQITIVIGTFNRSKVCLGLLQQIQQKVHINYEVIVFDQSDYEEYLDLKSEFPRSKKFQLVRLEEPNTCRYLNLGWQLARSEIVLYFDDDVEILNSTINAHIGAYSDSRVVGVAGRVLNDNEVVSKSNKVGKIIIFGAKITMNFSAEKSTNVDFVYGCNMSFRTKVLKLVGGFDEKLKGPVYTYNEVDLGYRVSKLADKVIKFIPEALVYHHRFPRGGTRSYSSEVIKNTTEFNYGYFIGKNFNITQNLFWILYRLPYQVLKDLGSTYYIFQGFIFAKKVFYSRS